MEKERKILDAYKILRDADTDFLVRLAVLVPQAILNTRDISLFEMEIKKLYADNKKIIAIKTYRQKTGVSLRESKEACEKITGVKGMYNDN